MWLYFLKLKKICMYKEKIQRIMKTSIHQRKMQIPAHVSIYNHLV